MDIADGSAAVAIRAAFQAWQDVPDASITFREVQGAHDITVQFLREWPPEFGAMTAAITINTHTLQDPGVIGVSEVNFNDRTFFWATNGRPDANDVQAVMTHEAGHAVGLAHSRVRTATMYWENTTAADRVLDPDDARGLVFLYGDGTGQGRVCDTCTVSDDCVAGGLCVSLDDDLRWCSEPCGAGDTCPEGAVCAVVGRRARRCVPREGFCSDAGGQGQLAVGEYCWGAAQCEAGSVCYALPDGPAQCTPACDGPQDCPAGLGCVNFSGAAQGYCIPQGQAEFGDACSTIFDCRSLLCHSLDADHSVCSEACDPQNNQCPGGVECLAVQGVPGLLGVCIPDGRVTEGGVCGDAGHRCGPGLRCVYETTDAPPVCRAICEPFGACGPGRGCTPYNFADWFCLPLDRSVAGEACNPEEAQCRGGLYCLRIDNVDGICVLPCDDRDARGCAGNACLEVDGPDAHLGACSPGAVAFGDPCDRTYQCLDFQCVHDAEGSMCSRLCSEASPCPAGFSCEQTIDGQHMCFRTDAMGAGGTPADAGGSATGGTPADAGAPAAGGSPAAGGAEGSAGTDETGGQPAATGGNAATGGTPVPADGGPPATGGSPETGGTPGPATGGPSETGGNAATGGTPDPAPGSDGVPTGDGVTDRDAGTAQRVPHPAADCRVAAPGSTARTPGSLLALFAIMWAASRRRRRTRLGPPSRRPALRPALPGPSAAGLLDMGSHAGRRRLRPRRRP